MQDELIKRINELSKKSKTTGLSEAEAAEQKELRTQFLAEFKSNFRKDMDNLYIKDKDGKEVSLKEVREKNNK